jgi:signal transduction histidine kinase
MLRNLRLHFLYSLQARLLLALLLVAGVAVSITSLFAKQGTDEVFTHYVTSNDARNKRLVYAYLQRASQIGSLDQKQIEALGRDFDADIFLVAPSGDVVIASDPVSVGKAMPVPPPDSAQKIVYQAEPVFFVMKAPDSMVALPAAGAVRWTAALPPNFPPGAVPISGQAVLGSVDQSFSIAAAMALTLAAGLAWVLSRRILDPVASLTEAARRMEKGQLSQRVPVTTNDEIGQLAHAFNAMAEGLARAEGLRRNLVTDVAHELRTPLTNVRGYLEALRDGVLEPTPAVIKLLHEEALLLNRLIDDLQDLALAEAGQLKLAPVPAPPGELIQGAVLAAQPAAAAKNITLQVEIPPDLPAAPMDEARIAQVLRNLLANALAHTPQHGRVVVGARTTETAIEVSVQDTGDGIPAEDLPFVFERFYRADKSRARETGGAGLGLAIVRQLVAAHGGQVWAESLAGQGARLTFTLPRR